MKLLSDTGLARINRAVVNGRIVPYLVAVMFFIMVAGTLAVEVLSPDAARHAEIVEPLARIEQRLDALDRPQR